jgi:hypothetical protein
VAEQDKGHAKGGKTRERAVSAATFDGNQAVVDARIGDLVAFIETIQTK